MTVLAIDTADRITGAAIIQDRLIIGERNLMLGKSRDEALSAMARGLLEDCGLKIKELTGVAVNCGPGSFTGLRVGTAYVKGLCLAENLPLAAVGSLEALAYTFRHCDRLIVPVIHAKGDEVYYAVYRWLHGELSPVREPSLANFREIAVILEEPAIVAGSGYAKHASEFTSTFPESTQVTPYGLIPTVRAVAEIGEKRIISQNTADLASFEPKYLQNFPRSI